MDTQTEQRYDVVIFEKATRKIESVAGKDMKSWNGVGRGYNTAELRLQTAHERINDHYDAAMVETGKYDVGDVLP